MVIFKGLELEILRPCGIALTEHNIRQYHGRNSVDVDIESSIDEPFSIKITPDLPFTYCKDDADVVAHLQESKEGAGQYPPFGFRVSYCFASRPDTTFETLLSLNPDHPLYTLHNGPSRSITNVVRGQGAKNITYQMFFPEKGARTVMDPLQQSLDPDEDAILDLETSMSTIGVDNGNTHDDSKQGAITVRFERIALGDAFSFDITKAKTDADGHDESALGPLEFDESIR